MRRIDLRRSDGVAMTEFALILPIFMVIVAGLLGFGRVFFYWIQANHVANETARWAIVDVNPYAPTDFAAGGCGQLELRVQLGHHGLHRAARHHTEGRRSADRDRREAVHVRADPEYRRDHGPRFLDDARRELPERCDTHRLHRDVWNMNRARSDERGQVIVLAAVMIPVFLLLTALVVDVGNWYTHKRQLQNRADAGAFAAGVEYQRAWEDCVQAGNSALKLDTARNIANAARRYAGDAEAADYEPTTSQPSPSTLSKYNTEIANQANVDVTINSNSPTYDDDLDYKDGRVGDRADPCYNHAGDAISPAGGYWTDVKVKEGLLPFARRLDPVILRHGRSVSKNGARARMEIRPVVENGFLPLGIADSQLSKVQVRLYKDCGDGAEIARQDLVKLPTDFQNGRSMTLWAKYDAVNGVESTQVPIPRIGDCGDPPPESVPVRVEVRIASREAEDITNPSCATLAAARYADCWTHLSHLRVYDGGGSPNARPVVRKIDLTSSERGTRLRPGRLFRTDAAGLDQLDVRDGCLCRCRLGNKPSSTGKHGFPGVRRGTRPSDDPSVDHSGRPVRGDVPGHGDRLPTRAARRRKPDLGEARMARYRPYASRGCFNAPLCTSDPATTLCVLYTETHQTAHQTFVGTDANAGIVELVRLSLDGVTTQRSQTPSGSVPAAPSAITPPAQLYFTVGLRNNLTFGRFTVIRAGDPQANSSTRL